MPRALFPGTFDPPTLGHLDVVERAAVLFGQVTIGLADHPDKQPVLSVEERLALLEECTADNDRIDVVRISGLVVEAAARLGAGVLVRGVRNSRDFDYEVEMARTNRVLSREVETVLLVPGPAHAHITGTLVRQIARFGGDVRELVPAPVARALEARFPRST